MPEQDGAAPDATEGTDGAVILYDWKTGETRVEGDGRAEDDHRAGDNHVDGAGGDNHHVGGDDRGEEPELAPAEPEPDLETLVAHWEMSTPEEQQVIRDRVLADFFAQAAGAHIAALIPTTKRADVVRPLLDQLGVDGMLQAMSSEFGRRLRAKVPAPKRKPTKLKFKTMQMVKTTAASGEPVFAQPRGNRSRAH